MYNIEEFRSRLLCEIEKHKKEGTLPQYINAEFVRRLTCIEKVTARGSQTETQCFEGGMQVSYKNQLLFILFEATKGRWNKREAGILARRTSKRAENHSTRAKDKWAGKTGELHTQAAKHHSQASQHFNAAHKSYSQGDTKTGDSYMRKGFHHYGKARDLESHHGLPIKPLSSKLKK